uniref:Hedgehog/Intein (Hint) domain-containing protein n=1 Tax=viral metagenome TaxID=1070528 RepID=A0A6C0HCS4_9ZZZZ
MSYNVSYFFDTPNSSFSGPSGSLCSLKSTSNLLYGYKSGTDYGIYSIQSDGTNLQVLVGLSTLESLYHLTYISTFVSDGNDTLYAIGIYTINNNDVLISFNTSTNTVTILHFLGDSWSPVYPLVIDTTNSILYGISIDSFNNFYIFSYDITSSVLTPSLYAFSSVTDGNPSGPLSISSDFTTLYGVSQVNDKLGYLYSINIAFPTFNTLYPFNNVIPNLMLSPKGRLLIDNNYLYGTFCVGGTYNLGGIFIFKLNTGSSGSLTKTISFNQNNYYNTIGGLIKVNNNLYGMAYSFSEVSTNNGSFKFSSTGSIWSYNLSANTFSTIHNFTFSPSDGFPGSNKGNNCGLALALDTVNSSTINILGLTWGGGNNIGGSGSGSPGDGTIFSISIDNGPPGPIVCYVKGTRILTIEGYKPIEELKNGDMLLTKGKIMDGIVNLSSGYSFEPVIWRSSFNVNKRNINKESSPICIKQHSFGINYPVRDLYVSPNHGICIRGKLVPAKNLINGRNIYQVRGLDGVEYHHVELDRHCIIISEGIFAESYINRNTKHLFKEAPTLKLKKLYHDDNKYNTNKKRNIISLTR